MEANLREEATYARRLAEQYRLIEIQINQQIAQFYQSFADAEHITLAEAQQRLSQDDVRNYEALAKKYVEMAAADRRNGTDRTKEYFSKKANDQMRIYNAMMKINRLELLKAELGMAVDQAMMDIGEDMDGALTKRTDDELRRQAGILGTTVFHNNEDVASIVNGSFHNASWSERIWGNGDQLKANLNILLTQGLIQGRNPRELARTLRKSYDASRYEAERLMRTELARVQTDAQMESFQRNGYDKYEFIALGTACKVCHGMDGKVFNVADGMPGENMPPVHPNCRCSTAAHFMAENDFVQMMRDKYGLDMRDRQGLADSGEYDIINKEDIDVIKSLSASGKKYPVLLPDGNHSRVIPGTSITGIKAIAGYGTKTVLREAARLEDVYKIPASEWQKVRGNAYVMFDGEKEYVELHWYEARNQQYEIKVKRVFENAKG